MAQLLLRTPPLLLRVLHYLDQDDVFALRNTCVPWRTKLDTLGVDAYPNLNLNGRLACELLLERFSRHTRHAKTLRVSFEFCNRATDATFALLSRFPELRHVNLNGGQAYTDAAVRRVMASCPKLTSLSLYWNVCVTNLGLALITESDQAPQLTSLNLSGVKKITDTGVASLARACRSLTFLDLTRCELIRDNALASIGAHLPHLTSLNLYAAAHYTDAGLVAIAKGCPRLQFVDLCGAHSISDAGLLALASSCPRITHFNLTWCTKLTDVSLGHIARYLRALRFVSLHGWLRITDAGLRTLAEGCRKLEELDVNGTHVDKSRIPALFPHLRTLVAL